MPIIDAKTQICFHSRIKKLKDYLVQLLRDINVWSSRYCPLIMSRTRWDNVMEENYNFGRGDLDAPPSSPLHCSTSTLRRTPPPPLLKMLNKQTHSEPSSDLRLRPRPDYGSARDFEPDFFRMDPGRGSGSNCWAGAASEPAVALWLYSTCPAPPPPTHPHSWPTLSWSTSWSTVLAVLVLSI